MPRVALVVLLAGLSPPAAVAWGQDAWRPGGGYSQLAWQPAGGDARWEIRHQRRVASPDGAGQECEFVQTYCSAGRFGYLRRPLRPVRVIDELWFSVRVKADRPGVQLFARVVLPRSKNPDSGDPVTTLVPGTAYTAAGRWQELRLDDLPQRLRRQLYALRGQLGPSVDGRQAYVDQILLNVCPGPGLTNVWIADPVVTGGIGVDQVGAETAEGSTPPAARQAEAMAREGSAERGGSSSAALVGSVLVCCGRPTFPRIVDWRGESLEMLAELGFNAVRMDRLPGRQTLDEAKRLGLRVVCPPPRPQAATLAAGSSAALAPLGAQYDPVLAWYLGSGLGADELPEVRRWAEMVRGADSQSARPLLLEAASEVYAYSRVADQLTVLLLGRPVLGTSLELDAYRRWLSERAELARAGTPFWAAIDTQPSGEVLDQLRGLAAGDSAPGSFSAAQIRLAAYTAVAAGARGLVFRSFSPLDAADPQTELRRLSLERVNLELALVEPWLATGQRGEMVPSNDPDVQALVLRANRSRLLVPLWLGRGAQCAPRPAGQSSLRFVVPGVPEHYRAFLVCPGLLRPLRRNRQTGGVRIGLDGLPLAAPILLTADPLLIARMSRAVARVGRRGAELNRKLAGLVWEQTQRRPPVAKTIQTEQGGRQLSGRVAAEASPPWRTALWALQWADGRLAAGDYGAAWLHSERALDILRLWQWQQWDRLVGRIGSPASAAAATGWATLPLLGRLQERLAASRPGPNRLPGGQFEDASTFLQTGWRFLPGGQSPVAATAELARVAAHSGQYGLRISAQVEGAQSDTVRLEAAPASICSPPVPVASGSLVAIRAWICLPEPISSPDGLMIVDSLGGEALAERVHRTDGWQQFTLYRIAPRSGTMSIWFVLTGLGEAWIDDATVQVADPAAVRTAQQSGPLCPWRLPPVGRAIY